MATAKRTKDTITIGSGIPYIVEFDAAAGLPDDKTICVDANRLGWVKGGAALEYTAETHTEKDDLGRKSKIIVTEEEAKLKLGVLTWNGDTLQKLIDRCQVTTADGVRTVKIGGAGNAQGKDWAVCFHHVDKQDGDVYVTIRGTNTAGLTLTFATDEGTVIEPEFTALPHDDEGTLVRITEEAATA